MRNEAEKLVESVPFMAGMTALGGFCNAYTFMTRGGVFANAHTANMAKVGISMATADWSGVMGALVPILGCLLGGVLCEFVKDKSQATPGWLGGHWYQKALVLELMALLVVGFVPATVPHGVVNAAMSLVTGFQLNIFRNWKYGGHNTTICTGNLRNLAQWVYAALTQRNVGMGKKAVAYTGLFVAFTLGAVIATLLCIRLGVQASWCACLFLAVWLVWLWVDERKASVAQ